MSAGEPPTIRGEARRWTGRADQDLRVARLALSATPALTDAAAFHVQQAAEKLPKALLILADREVPKTHDLARLIRLLDAPAPLPADLAATLPSLTSWVAAGRYPDVAESDTPSGEEIDAAVGSVDRLARLVAARIDGTPP